jgi:S1-C subfamily serine protease
MSVVDWVIVAFTALLALQGYARGLIVGLLSLAGFAGGALLGSRVAPLILPRGAHSPYTPLFGLVGALILGGLLATGFESAGRAVRRVLPLPGLRLLDGLAGALFAGCFALGVAWIAGALLLLSSSSGPLRHDLRASTILRELDRLLPPSGPILNALARFDPLPSVSGPAVNVPPPTRGALAARGVREAAGSVVRVVGSACGLGIEGSGWVAAPGIVVTNAHVIAGESDTTVEVGGAGGGLPAEPLVFDVHDDIAVLRVPGLRSQALALGGAATPGQEVAILGYPENGPYDAQPGRVGATQLTETEDAYGHGPVLREISSVRGLVRPGNSGGPLVDPEGQVLGTIFAAATNTPPGERSGYAVPDSVVARELAAARRRSAAVSSGPCGD